MRVEKHSVLEERLSDVKGDLVKEVRRRTHVSRPWLTCSMVMLVLFLVAALWGAWSVAATGLVRVPVFTALAYDTPVPYREVTPGVSVETYLNEVFTSTLTRRLYEGGGQLTNRSIEVRLSEASLTASVRTFLEESELSWIDASHAQVVIDPEVGAEVFVPFDASLAGQRSALRLQFELSTQDGKLMVVPTTVLVGNAHIPDFVTATFFKPLLEAELAKLNTVMVGYAQISRIEILPRELLISGELAVELN
jgi:hypothetical protein